MKEKVNEFWKPQQTIWDPLCGYLHLLLSMFLCQIHILVMRAQPIFFLIFLKVSTGPSNKNLLRKQIALIKAEERLA